MVTRKYIKDYKLSESVTERGGIRTEAVYVGKHFEFADEAGAKKCARPLLWGGCAAWLLFLGRSCRGRGLQSSCGSYCPLHFPRCLWAI